MSLRHELDVRHADWFARSGDDWRQLCSIGPSGFASYARVLHPTDADIADEKLRLMNVEGLVDDAIFEPVREVLVRHTSTPGDCFHGLWDGHGEIHGGLVTRIEVGKGSTSWHEPPAFDADVLDGPQVVTNVPTGRD